jgi:peptide chain release factor 1
MEIRERDGRTAKVTYYAFMIDVVKHLAKECSELQEQLKDPEISSDRTRLIEISRRIKQLEPIAALYSEYDSCENVIKEATAVTDDPELRELAESEAHAAHARMKELEEMMREAILSADATDARNVALEVRAGTGGDEAALFAGELLRMYLKCAESMGFQTDLLSKTDADGGGIKEASIRIEGEGSGGSGAYGTFKFESGVHRVQRVPVTESKGRLHTSAATVAVLPEVETSVNLEIRPEDIRIDTYRASGAGGQHVNKTDSAVRVTHLPTNTVTQCQSSRSQLKNREVAMELLRSKLYVMQEEEQRRKEGELRSGQVGSGDRSEKIRTYNFPQDRITDHRIAKNFSSIETVMTGELVPILTALKEWNDAQKLAQMTKKS